MATTFSNTSTVKPQGVFGGASVPNSMTRWTPTLYLASDEPGTEIMRFVHEYPNGAQLKLEFEATSRQDVMPEDAILRWFCHAYIQMLPFEAIDSVWENISETWDWYMHPILPPTPEEQEPGMMMGRIFDPVEEDPFTVLEE